MTGVKGKTGSPGTPNPKKKNSTSFAVPPGVEPKGRMIGFRPLQSLEREIDEAVAASGLKLSDWLMEAAKAHLKKKPPELAEGRKLEQGQLNSAGGTAQDAITTESTNAAGNGRQTPATGDTSESEAQGKGKQSPRSRRARKTA